MSTLFVDEPGLHLCRRGERLQLEKDGAIVGGLRLQDLSRVVVCDHAALTSAALDACLRAGIEVAFVSRGGEFLGRLVPAAAGPDGELRRTQWALSRDETARATLARLAVLAKLEGQRYRLRQWARHRPDLAAPLVEFETALGRLDQFDTAALLGLEGAAARAYFDCLGRLVPEPFTFTRRERHPAPDPVNALLGFCYALVENEVAEAAVGAGLDLDVGFLHEVSRRRDSLVLDLLEEFRPLLADAVAIRLLTRRQLQLDDFEPAPADPAAIWLTERGRATVFRELEGQLQGTVARRDEPARTWREQLRGQVRDFATALREVGRGEPPRSFRPLAADLR